MKHFALPLLLTAILTWSCSTTRNIPRGDRLFIGLTKIDYKDYEKNEQFETTREEVEAALATRPNGALFGSSYYRSPFQYRLWIWNAFAGKKDKLSRWITSSFGKAPVLMSQVNPQLRASVAQSVLRGHGYFGGRVDYTTVPQGSKKARIGYNVSFGPLMTIDSVNYAGFPDEADSLIRHTLKDAAIKPGDAFDASALDAERTRLARLFRNNGYFYYQSSYASYLADTVNVKGKANLRLQMADNIPAAARRKWYIGKVYINMRKQFMEQLADSFAHRYFVVRYNGKRPPIRPRVIIRDLKLRPRQMFSYDNYTESANKINGSGQFSSVEFNFTPRDTTAACDTLDLTLNCTFSKPYDFYVETNLTSYTTGRTGPELVIGLTRRNAFRGGEKLDINLHGSYEWQKGGSLNGPAKNLNSYEYGADVSLEFPRLLVPFLKRRTRFFTTPSTYAKASMNVLNRPGYFRMHTAGGEWTYRWQKTDRWRHEFSPFVLQYQKLNTTTQKFDSIMQANPYLMVSMQDVFIPKMRYTATFSNSKTSRYPFVWNVTLSEAGNVTSLVNMAMGNKWSTRYKQLFKNPYAQFVKLETDLTKTWVTGQKSQLVAHLSGGLIYTFGNSDQAPYTEQFYVGGANSVRAFAVRSIGPGSYRAGTSRLSYLDQTGDIKLQANLEYRFNLFGNVYGATFLDAGNVWALRDDGYRRGSQLKLRNLPGELALGTGIGLRYDLEFLVLRLDWGVGLHVPFDTGTRGYFNIPKFRDGQTLHFAVGYPF